MVRTVSVTSMCEREDWSLRPVAVVVRVALPCLISARQWLAVCTGSEVQSLVGVGVRVRIRARDRARAKG